MAKGPEASRSNASQSPKSDWQRVREKEWRPKKIPRGDEPAKTNGSHLATAKISFFLDNKSWNDLVSFLRDRGLFLKWIGDWPTVSHVRNWCEENWPFKVDLKMMPNGFFLAIMEDNKNKNWVLNNGPFFMGGRGLYARDWEPNFNPLKAHLELVPIWLRLYNLPREY